jgi:hypothetical protein
VTCEKHPNKIHDPYVTFLKKHEIPSREIPFYPKWLQYYLDFCDKNAITLFYKLIESYKSNSSQSIVQSNVSAEKPKYDSTAGSYVSKNKSWKNEFEVLNNEIRLRLYSRKTLRAYSTWVKSFQAYLKTLRYPRPKQIKRLLALYSNRIQTPGFDYNWVPLAV